MSGSKGNNFIGSLIHRIELQRPVSSQSASGAVDKSWLSVGTFYAKRLGAKGREYYAAGVELGVIEQAFQIRHNSVVAAVDATWRLIFEGRIYNILGAEESTSRDYLTLLCKSGADRG